MAAMQPSAPNPLSSDPKSFVTQPLSSLAEVPFYVLHPVGISGPGAHTRPLALPARPGTVIAGLGNGVLVPLPWTQGFENISMRHAAFEFVGVDPNDAERHEFALTDLDSAKGVFVNTIRIPANRRISVFTGDVVSFGSSIFLPSLTDPNPYTYMILQFRQTVAGRMRAADINPLPPIPRETEPLSPLQERAATCQVCFEFMHKPVATQCNHVMCKECLWTEYRLSQLVVPACHVACPCCKKPHNMLSTVPLVDLDVTIRKDVWPRLQKEQRLRMQQKIENTIVLGRLETQVLNRVEWYREMTTKCIARELALQQEWEVQNAAKKHAQAQADAVKNASASVPKRKRTPPAPRSKPHVADSDISDDWTP